MKNLYYISVLFLTGCLFGGGVSKPKWWNPFDGGNIAPEQIEVHRTFDAFAPYHFLALAMFAVGWVMVIWSKKNTVAGFGTIAFATVLSVWAYYLPTHGWAVTTLLSIGCVIGLGYLLYNKRVNLKSRLDKMK